MQISSGSPRISPAVERGVAVNIDVSFLPATGAAFLLVFARTGTMLMLLPGLGEQNISARIRLTIAMVLAAALITISYAFGKRVRNRVKDMPYESGIVPTGDARQRGSRFDSHAEGLMGAST